MTNEQKQVKDWMQKFGQECPEKPTIPSLEVRKLRAKLILEEALETIEALGFHVARNAMETVKFIEHGNGPNLLEIADGCEDLKIVTEGTLVACGLIENKCEHKYDNLKPVSDYSKCLTCGETFVESFNKTKQDPLFNEVMRSNNSKMWSVDEYTIALDDLSKKPYMTVCTSVYNEQGSIIGVIVKDQHGKVIKPPSYSSANLQPIIDEVLAQ